MVTLLSRLATASNTNDNERFTIIVTGRDCHTGTTDLGSRSDALLAASNMIMRSRELALEHAALASTGIIEAKPGSTNTVPGHVTFSLDIRAPHDETVARLEQALRDAFAEIAGGKPSNNRVSDRVQIEWRQDSDSPAVHFHPDCIQCVSEGVREILGADAEKLSKPMTSGAGHDSVYTSKRVPTCMIFVPSKNGVSHNPEEYTAPEDCALGAQVLLEAVVRYDRLRKSRG